MHHTSPASCNMREEIINHLFFKHKLMMSPRHQFLLQRDRRTRASTRIWTSFRNQMSVCVCVCGSARAPAYVCVFQNGCTEPQPGAIPDYPSLSFNTPACVCVCHTCKHTPMDTHMQNILRRPTSVDPSQSMNGFN